MVSNHMAPTVRNLQGGREVLLLPTSIYRSELTGTPTGRFRIGIGRLDPEPALDAFAAWLRAL
jgi:hypothetical protein